MENAAPDPIDEEQTTPLPRETMADLVFGRDVDCVVFAGDDEGKSVPLSDLYRDEEIPCAPFGIGGAR